MIHVAIEGNIGSGKSTLVSSLYAQLSQKSKVKVSIIPEPIEQWIAFGSTKENILNLMYKDPKANSFLFQVMASVTKCEELLENKEKGIHLVERSLEAQSKIFIPMLMENGNLTVSEKELLDRMIGMLLEVGNSIKPDVIIYLKASPEIAMERIRKRGRKEEEGISMNYLSDLNTKYDKWLGNSENKKVLILDANSHKLFDTSEVAKAIMDLIKH